MQNIPLFYAWHFHFCKNYITNCAFVNVIYKLANPIISVL